MVEQDRIDWDSTGFEPLALRVGIGRSSIGRFIDGCHRDSIDPGAEAGRIRSVLRKDLQCARLTLPTIG
jgi:hypothetical protein